MRRGEASCHCEGTQRPKQSHPSAEPMPEGIAPVLAGDCFASLRSARNDNRESTSYQKTFASSAEPDSRPALPRLCVIPTAPMCCPFNP